MVLKKTCGFELALLNDNGFIVVCIRLLRLQSKLHSWQSTYSRLLSKNVLKDQTMLTRPDYKSSSYLVSHLKMWYVVNSKKNQIDSLYTFKWYASMPKDIKFILGYETSNLFWNIIFMRVLRSYVQYMHQKKVISRIGTWLTRW